MKNNMAQMYTVANNSAKNPSNPIFTDFAA